MRRSCPDIAALLIAAHALCACPASIAGETPAAAPVPAKIPRPTPEQAAWQDLELGMFFHLDIPIFTEDGEGGGYSCAGPKALSDGELMQ